MSRFNTFSQFVSTLIASFMLTACAGGDEVYQDEDLGQSEQDISTRNYYGVSYTNQQECNLTGSCYYPPSRTLGIRLDTGGLVSTELPQAQSALGAVLIDFNAQLAVHGWSLTQLTGAAGSTANVVVRFINSPLGPTPTASNLYQIVFLECTAPGAVALTESPAIGGTHYMCGKTRGNILIDQIRMLNASQREALFEHAIGATVLAAAGRGPTFIGNQTGYSAASLAPFNKVGMSPKDVCLLDAYGLTQPTVISLQPWTTCDNL
jgi:hypothetical protein